MSALKHLVERSSPMGTFDGVEPKLRSPSGKLTPDVTWTYDSGRKGIAFDVKWSISSVDQIEELKKYAKALEGWNTNNHGVNSVDVVLVCHGDDGKKVLGMIKQIDDKTESIFKINGFAVWTWDIVASRNGHREDSMIIRSIYGETRNKHLEEKVANPAGIRLGKEALTYLRFLYAFVRQKPPIQYTITVLAQQVLSGFTRKPVREIHEISIGLIIEKAKALFPSWTDNELVQVRKRWITEALDKMSELRLIEKKNDHSYLIPILVIYRSREDFDLTICKKLDKLARKKKPGRPKRITRPSRSETDAAITDFLS